MALMAVCRVTVSLKACGESTPDYVRLNGPYLYTCIIKLYRRLSTLYSTVRKRPPKLGVRCERDPRTLRWTVGLTVGLTNYHYAYHSTLTTLSLTK